MGKLVKALAGDGTVLCCAVDTTDVVGEAERIHKTSAVVTAALGRLLSAASMMGAMCKGERDSVTVRLAGDGPASPLLAVADSGGHVRGYAAQPVVEIPLNEKGKLDVAGAVGRAGMLYVTLDAGTGEPYIGQTPIVSGEIAEDITHYYAASQQTPTVCSLGVLVNPDLSVAAAGGFLVQLLPGAPEEAVGRLEKNIAAMPPVSALLRGGNTAQALAMRALEGFQARVLEEREVFYRCDCSRQRMERALLAMGREELLKLAGEQPETEVCCHFCGKKRIFTPAQLRQLAVR